jgi:hypothetical protein
VIERADPEAELIDREAALLEAQDELGREHLQLVGPDARRDLDDEHATLERDGARALGDAWPDGRAPLGDRDRQLLLGEAVLARTFEEALDRLGRLERPAGPSLRHEGTMVASKLG